MRDRLRIFVIKRRVSYSFQFYYSKLNFPVLEFYFFFETSSNVHKSPNV